MFYYKKGSLTYFLKDLTKVGKDTLFGSVKNEDKKKYSQTLLIKLKTEIECNKVKTVMSKDFLTDLKEGPQVDCMVFLNLDDFYKSRGRLSEFDFGLFCKFSCRFLPCFEL